MGHNNEPINTATIPAFCQTRLVYQKKKHTHTRIAFQIRRGRELISIIIFYLSYTWKPKKHASQPHLGLDKHDSSSRTRHTRVWRMRKRARTRESPLYLLECTSSSQRSSRSSRLRKMKNRAKNNLRQANLILIFITSTLPSQARG